MPYHQVNIDEVFRQLLDEDIAKCPEHSWEAMFMLLGQFMPTDDYPTVVSEKLSSIVTHV